MSRQRVWSGALGLVVGGCVWAAASHHEPHGSAALTMAFNRSLVDVSTSSVVLEYQTTDLPGTQRRLSLARHAEQLELSDAATGTVVATAPADRVRSVRIVGAPDNDDTLAIDFTGGAIVLPDGIHYDGGSAGFDSLELNGGTFEHSSYSPRPPQSGTLTFDDLTITFDNLEPVIDGTASSTYTINASDAFNTITVDEGVSGFDGYFRIQVDALESVELSNKAFVTINAGLTAGDFGDDIIVDFTDTTTGLSTLSINGLGGVDIARVRHTPSNVTTGITGGASNDVVHLSDVAQLLTQVAGPVQFLGGGGSDEFYVHNDSSSAAQNVQATATSIAVGSVVHSYDSEVEQVYVTMGSGQNVAYIQASSAATTLNIDLQGGNDSATFGTAFDLSALLGAVNLTGGANTDAILFMDYGTAVGHAYALGSTALTRTGTGTLAFSAVETVTLLASDGTNAIGVNGVASGAAVTVQAGLGDDTITLGAVSQELNAFVGTLDVVGDGGADTIVFDDRANSAGTAYALNATTFVRSSFGGATFAAENVLLRAGSSSSIITHTGNGAGMTTVIESGAGSDTVTLLTGADPFLGTVTVVGGADNDRVELDDGNNTAGDTFLVYSSGITRTGLGVFHLMDASNETVDLSMGSGSNQVDLEYAPAANALRIYGGGGNDVVQAALGSGSLANLRGFSLFNGENGIDTLSLHDQLNSAGLYLVGAGSFGRFSSGSGPESVTLTALEALALRTSDGADAVYVQGTPAPLSVDTGGGNDTIDFDSNASVAGGTVDLIAHNATVSGGAGTNTVTFEDGSDASADHVNIAGDVINTSSGGLLFGANVSVSLSNVATATLRLGSGDNTVSILPTANIAWTIEGGSHSSGDTINLSANCGPAPVGGAASPYTLAGRLPVTYSQFESATMNRVLTLSPLSQVVGGAATTGLTLSVATTDCTWTAIPNVSWIAVTGGASGTGNGTIVFNVAENLSDVDLRPGTIAVESAAASVLQHVSPVLTAYTPAAGSTAGGTVVTITGHNFTGVTAYFDGVPATSQARLDVNRLAVVAPPHAAGAVEFRIEHTNGAAVSVGSGFTYVASSATDTDGDGMPDDWELRYNLDPTASDATLDPDGDGITNINEYAQDSHPRGFFKRYLAEGATSAFFRTQLALFNPNTVTSPTLVTFQRADGSTRTQFTSLLATRRSTTDVGALTGLEAAEFSTVIESEFLVVADRTMQWGGGYGTHSETSLASPSTVWYLAEGATSGDFELFYLIQNPQAVPATITVSYLRPGGVAAIGRTYTVPARSRFNIWVDLVAPELASTDVSAKITADVPVIVERAMYLTRSGVTFLAGHESAGVTTPSTNWFLAEGATGDYFDLFVLIANTNPGPVSATATYLLPDGTTIVRTYTIPADSRFNIWVDLEDARLANTAVSTTLTASAPVVVERAMWWPGPTSATWHEAHNSPGTTATATRWAFAEGEDGGTLQQQTYFLVANTSAFAGTVQAAIYFEDGTSATRTYSIPARSRFNVDVRGEFPAAVGRRFGAVFASQGGTPAQIVVERAMYSDHNGVHWAGGTNALGMPVP